jgi:hypothetical protein
MLKIINGLLPIFNEAANMVEYAIPKAFVANTLQGNLL